MNKIIAKIKNRMKQVDSMAGVGIDPVFSRIPSFIKTSSHFNNESDIIFAFGKGIIEATYKYVVDFKVNANFFMNSNSRLALEKVFSYLQEQHPEVVRICDGKFGDVNHTASQIANYIFDVLNADAVLLNPYMGFDAIKPFVEREDKLVVLCINTSNPSAKEIQETRLSNGRSLWRYILDLSLTKWNKHGNVIPVISATHIDNLRSIRQVIKDLPVVLAGIGTQGGNLRQALPHVLDKDGYGAMISSSRQIIYLDNYLSKDQEVYWHEVSKRAKSLRDKINSIKQEIIYGQRNKKLS